MTHNGTCIHGVCDTQRCQSKQTKGVVYAREKTIHVCINVSQGSFAKETYNFKEPTNRSHPICIDLYICIVVFYKKDRGVGVSRRMYICVDLYIHTCTSLDLQRRHVGWLRLVGSLKLYVSFAKEPYEIYFFLYIWRTIYIQSFTYRLGRRSKQTHIYINVYMYRCIYIHVYLYIHIVFS